MQTVWPDQLNRRSYGANKLNGLLCYGKNITMTFGRCPVRSIFEEALGVFRTQHKRIAFLCGKKMSIEDAPQAYKDFEARKTTKVIFKLNDPAGHVNH